MGLMGWLDFEIAQMDLRIGCNYQKRKRKKKKNNGTIFLGWCYDPRGSFSLFFGFLFS
jgi:hypothetical protein